MLIKTFKIYNRLSDKITEYNCQVISRKELINKQFKEDVHYRCTHDGYDIYVSNRYWKYYAIKAK